jgi:hypothetical protein
LMVALMVDSLEDSLVALSVDLTAASMVEKMKRLSGMRTVA